MRKYLVIIILGLFLMGCSITTKVITPEGDIYVVHSKRNALVELQRGDEKLTVDNRGRPGKLEKVLEYMSQVQIFDSAALYWALTQDQTNSLQLFPP